MVIISIITLMVMSLMMTIDDDHQDNYEEDDMDGCDYQNYRFKISLRQGLYWICPSWGFDSRSASLFKVQILRAKYVVEKKRTYQHWPIPKRSEQKCP